MPDTRESVLINKLALEYRKLRSLAIPGVVEWDPKQINNTAAMQVYSGIVSKTANKMDLTHVKEFTRMKKRENFE